MDICILIYHQKTPLHYILSRYSNKALVFKHVKMKL